MRNGDTTTLLLGEKKGFILGNQIKGILHFLLLFSASLLAQIPLNNFGHSEIIKTYSGYTKFTLLDFNNDGIEDVFLFGNKRKNFTVHEGLKDSTFAEAVRKFFFFPIDDIKYFTKSERGEDYYLFVSRNKRLVGLVSFTKSKTLQLLHKIELDSYPSAIKIVDINKDNKPEALIYGNNFSGLAIVENKGYRLYINKIINDKIFTDALVCDFNQDYYEEVILTDLLNNSINFYESATNSVLQSIREIEFDETITKTKIVNYNGDDFYDIAVANELGMEILLGDSVYSFTETVKLNFNSIIDDFEFYDFNLDGSEDIVLLNKIDDEIILNFDKTNDDSNLIYSFPGITGFTSMKNESNSSLITLSKNGKLNVFTNLNCWGNSFSFYAGGKPTIVKYLQNEKTNTTDFAIYNEDKKIVNIVQTDSVGNFSNLIMVPFTNSITDFVISSDLNFIVGYNKGDKLLEKISFPDSNKNIIKHFMYADYPLNFVLVDSASNIVTSELDIGKLYIQKFIKTENSYASEQPMIIDSSVVSVTFELGKYETIYWKQFENKKILISENDGKRDTVINVDDSEMFESFFIKNDSYNSQPTIIYMKNEEEEILYFPTLELEKEIEIDKNIVSSASNAEDIFYFKDVEDNTERIFYNNKNENQIIELEYNLKKNKFEQTKIIETIKTNNFCVEKIFGVIYLVYTNVDNNNISFKVIS
ncbi:MAG: hypothetical protein GY936_17370 [Ignavibacteriae bacterium]|nr:hypothetical protein [Ignavibacteriota bacterium]